MRSYRMRVISMPVFHAAVSSTWEAGRGRLIRGASMSRAPCHIPPGANEGTGVGRT